MGPDDAGGSVMCAYARAICSSYSSAFPARATPLCSFTSDWSPDHQGVGHCLIASWVSCAKDVKSLLERLARRLNSIIVENFHKYNDCHKNYRTIRGESQSDSSRHREVVVLHRCGEMRSALGGTYPGRSEEHTSELQSLAYLVCRLLLEKKKKKKFTINRIVNM